MPTYVAFLRAINLGAKRRFPQDAVVAATESAGFSDVAAYLNTGNVRLATPMRSRARVETALEEAYAASQGFEVPSVVFTRAELREVVAEADRLSNGREGAHYVSLLKDTPSAAAARALEARSTEGERVHVSDRAVHLQLGVAYREARLTNAVVEKELGVATNRNLTVIRTLVQRWC